MICLLVSAGQVAPGAVLYFLTGAVAAGRAVSAQRLDALGTAKPLRQLTPKHTADQIGRIHKRDTRQQAIPTGWADGTEQAVQHWSGATRYSHESCK